MYTRLLHNFFYFYVLTSYNVIVFLGLVPAPTHGTLSLKLKAGAFSNVEMPETVESMWGPVPLRRLPQGAVHHCTVANHT